MARVDGDRGSPVDICAACARSRGCGLRKSACGRVERDGVDGGGRDGRCERAGVGVVVVKLALGERDASTARRIS